MNKTITLVLIAEFWITIGQVCFKKSANRLNAQETDGKSWIMHLLGSVFSYPTLWIGATAILVGMLFWFAALSSGELNSVYLLGSIQYIFALFAAHYFLHEKINKTKLIGTLLITLGIILTAAS
ncbi:MAG: EamA family transporter [Candidatus Omnitrophica bacterium]|nr:EamA family transporter [Candidatus Omnitrophota bacterium]